MALQGVPLRYKNKTTMARTIFSKDPVKFIPALAEALKGMPEFEIPEWAVYVKSGVSRERPPVSDDFWYTRAASILRQLYIHGVVGVGKLRTRYGSRKNRGGRPDHFFKSSGKIIRVILQQAEAAGLVEKILRMQHGRRLTQAGRDLLDSIEAEDKVGLNFEDVSVKTLLSQSEIVEKLDSEKSEELPLGKDSDSEEPEEFSSAGDLADDKDVEEEVKVEDDTNGE